MELGRADLAFDVAGPNGHGTLELSAAKDGPFWTFRELTVTAENGATFDLTPRAPVRDR